MRQATKRRYEETENIQILWPSGGIHLQALCAAVPGAQSAP